MKYVDYYVRRYEWPNGARCTYATASLTTTPQQRRAVDAASAAFGGQPVLHINTDYAELD